MGDDAPVVRLKYIIESRYAAALLTGSSMYWVRRLLIALGLVGLLVGIALTALLVLVDPNDYKSALQEVMQERYDRNLAIDGDIRLSVIPRLGLEVSGVSLSEPGSKQVFATVDTARMAVAWWPMLSRHLVMEHLSVSGVKANVVRDVSGRFNFHDLLQKQHDPAGNGASASAESHEEPSVQLDIGGISLNGGEIAFRDDVHEAAMRVGRLTLSASDISFGRPFDFSMSGRMLGQSPRADATVQMQGAMMLDPHADRYAVQGLDLRVAGVLPSVRANTFTVRGNADVDAQAKTVDINGLAVAFQGDIALSMPLTGVDAQITVPRLRANMALDDISLEKAVIKTSGRMGNVPFAFLLDAPGLTITDQAVSGQPIQASFNREGTQSLSAKLTLSEIGGRAHSLQVGSVKLTGQAGRADRMTEFTAESALTGSPAGRNVELSDLVGTVRIQDAALPGGRMEIPAKGRLALDMVRQTLAGAVQARVHDSDLETSFDIAGFDNPALTFQVEAGRLNLDELWPATQAVETSAPAPASAPAPKPGEVGGASSESAIDLSGLRRINANGTVRVANLLARGVQVQDLAGKLHLAEGKATISDIAARVYEGTLAGQVSVNAENNQWTAQTRFTDVSVQPLLKAIAQYEALQGRGSVVLDLQSSGKTASALRRGLDGRVQVNLRDGRFNGINVAQSLREFKALLGRGENAEQQADISRSTDFSELRATLHLQQGVGALRDMLLAAPFLRITDGEPRTVNLADNTFDLMLNAKVVNTSTGQDGKALELLQDVTIPILVTGPLDAPKYAVQWREVSSEALERSLKNEAQRQLDRLLERRRESGGEEPAEGENPTGKILGEALKGLFNQ